MNADKDFKFVLRVLNSSENNEHIKTSDKLFENFKDKWKRKMECFELVDYMFKYKVERKKNKKSI
jgi:hypothetical protein